MLGLPQETVEAALKDWRSSPLSPKQKAAMALIEALILRPQKLDLDDLRAAMDAGLDDEAMQDVANICFHYNFINRMADAFDFPLPDEVQKKKLAKLLQRMGSLIRKSPASGAISGTDKNLRPPELQAARRTLLEMPNITEPSLREAVEAYAAQQQGAQRPDISVPSELESYLKKLSLYAYKILDKDIDSLKEHGYTEEMIVELTFIGGFGASLACVEKFFSVREQLEQK